MTRSLYIIGKTGVRSRSCTQCGIMKPLAKFNKMKRSRDGHRAECKVCTASRYQNYFKDNSDKIKTGRAKSARRAAGVPEPTTGKPKTCDLCGKNTQVLCVDHDHETGLFRGWLCRSCNLGLGLLGDQLCSVSAAIQYLNRATRNVVGN